MKTLNKLSNLPDSQKAIISATAIIILCIISQLIELAK